MANLKNIRSQIKSVTSIQKVTKAMKMVAAAKLRKSQDNMEKARPYSERLKSLITDLIQDVDRALMPLLTKRDNINKTAFVIVTVIFGFLLKFILPKSREYLADDLPIILADIYSKPYRWIFYILIF